MEFITTLFLAYLVCSPMIILGLENHFLFSARIPRVFRLLCLCISSNPYKEFKIIAQKSFYSKQYEFPYIPGNDEWYERRINCGYSKRIGWRNTLILANRILEFRIWFSLRSCQNYDQLRVYAEALLQGIDSSEIVFVSSPLYAHPLGINGGIRELRSAIIEIAENHNGLVFNQIPFLNHYIPRLGNTETRSKFEMFYQPVISSPYIAKVVMNMGWENSLGCKTEYETACNYNKKVEYLSLEKTSLAYS